LPEDADCTDIKECLASARIESNLPIGVGLGSSASLSCAVAQCFNQPDNFEVAKRFDDYFHEGSSGIDVFTIISGGLCSLNPERGFEKCSNDLFTRLDRFCFSLINTGSQRKVSLVKSQLDGVKTSMYGKHMQTISEAFFEQLSSDTLTLPALCQLFNDANSRLIELGVSTPQLNELFCRLRDSGLELGAKITGGGGGGCVLLVHSPQLSRDDLLAFVPAGGGSLYYQIKLKS
jgi:mevalonate kinase